MTLGELRKFAALSGSQHCHPYMSLYPQDAVELLAEVDRLTRKATQVAMTETAWTEKHNPAPQARTREQWEAKWTERGAPDEQNQASVSGAAFHALMTRVANLENERREGHVLNLIMRIERKLKTQDADLTRAQERLSVLENLSESNGERLTEMQEEIDRARSGA